MKLGRPPKAGVARTPSGQISRAKTGGLYFVYVAYFHSLGVLKVGRTGDVAMRTQQLRSEIGEKPIICAEYRLGTLDDSRACEDEAIEYFAARCDQKRGKEWFSVVADRLPALISGFYPKSVKTIGGVRVIGGSHRNHNAFEAERRPTIKNLYGHRARI